MMHWLLPWEFDPLAVPALALALGGYILGIWRGARPSFWSVLGYGLGCLLMYAVLHTRFDYYAQYLFTAHRGQHLVLHHLGPFLIAISNPVQVWSRALGGRIRIPRWLCRLYQEIQDPVVAPILFVGLIYLWLIPDIHFDAMLSRTRYLLMNWSMAIDGLLFWWLMLVPRGPGHVRDFGYLLRFVILLAVMFPQILLGVYISMGPSDLYDVYSVCGRALAWPPELDQLFGGLLTWIPPAMMCVLGAMIVLARWTNEQPA